MKRWLIRLAVVLLVLVGCGEAAVVWARYMLSQPGPSVATSTVVIQRGQKTREIAEMLGEAGIVRWPLLFRAELLLTGKYRLQAGEYALPAHASMEMVIEMMNLGHVVLRKVTIPEGLTVAEIMARLRDASGLQGKVGLPPDEGSLLPETYHYSYGDSLDSVLSKMHKGMTQLLDDQWARRDPDSPLQNKIEALILASVVEKETSLPQERPHVAAVFLNRLRYHMKLQSDPTVIYALTQGQDPLGRSLTRDDLAQPSPYNTYANEGLPVGPICNPGKASVMAVLHPARSDDLFFVADGSGGHAFARSLADHNRNVARWRALQTDKAASDSAGEVIKAAEGTTTPRGKKKASARE